MTTDSGLTFEQDEQKAREESRQKCSRQLVAVEDLLNAFLDGFRLHGDFTRTPENEKQFVQLLYVIRSFNSLRCAFELAQTGYYNQAIMLMRHTLEDLVVCYHCERNPKLVKDLLQGKEQPHNFSEMARSEGGKFAAWWKAKYDDLSLLAHPRSPGLGMTVSRQDQSIRLGPYFDPDLLLATVYYLLIILMHFLNVFRVILKSKDPASAEVWAQPTLEKIKQANQLIEEIAEELDPEGRLAMKEALLAPEGEATPWEEYKKKRAGRVRNPEP